MLSAKQEGSIYQIQVFNMNDIYEFLKRDWVNWAFTRFIWTFNI